jgi:hypothetical protein
VSALNKVKYQQFVRQARGAQISEVHVRRQDKGKAVHVQYNAKARKGRGQLNGVWSIARDEKSDEQIVTEIKTFLDLVRKDFFVKRGEGLQGDALADAKQEAEVKPIVKGDES